MHNTMSEINLEEIEELKPLIKPKTKFTLLELYGGTRELCVSRGWVDAREGRLLGFSKPRERKMWQLMPRLHRGVIVLKGHEQSRPVFECHAPAQQNHYHVQYNPNMCRFIDHNEEGLDALIAYLKKHMLFHTMNPMQGMEFLTEMRPVSAEDGRLGNRTIVDPNFKWKLFEGLGPALDIGIPTPVEPKRVSLLVAVEKEKLMSQVGIEARLPLYKIFMPEGAGTWLLYSMEDDGDTLWAVCDIGQGCVEYGTVSLKDLETLRGSVIGLPCERDTFFDPESNPDKYAMSRLLDLETLNGI